MEKSVKITWIVSGTFIVVALIIVFGLFQFSLERNVNTISSTGYSEISVVPDKVSLHFNVETSGGDSNEANEANSLIVNKVISRLEELDFEKEEIQTTNFQIYEDMEWTPSGRRSLGWKAIHSLVLKMNSSETEKIGSAIDRGVESGAILSYINFELSSDLETKFKAQAIRAATEDAKLKAEALAEGSGNSLGKLVSLSDQNFGYSPWIAYDSVKDATVPQEMDGARVATTIQPEERVISAQVSAVFKIN